MKYLKKNLIWLLVIATLLLAGCGPIEQRLADGTAVAAGKQVSQPIAGGQQGSDGSGGGEDVSDAQLTANAWEKTLQASLDALMSLTPAPTDTLQPTQLAEGSSTEGVEDADSTPTIDPVKLTSLAETLTAIAAGTATPTPTKPATKTPTQGATTTTEGTPVPTEVPCLAFRFVADVTYPPGTEVNPSSTFFKSWQVQNTGTCTWTGDYAIVYEAGFQLGGQSPLLLGSGVAIAPQQYVTLTIQLWTPPQSGTYTSSWFLQDSNGNTFGGGQNQLEPLFVRVVVPGESPPEFTNPVSTAPPFYTSTPTP